MKERTQRSAGAQKRASKKYPKILAVPLSAEEIQQRHQLTSADMRRVRRILDRVNERRSTSAK